jgi:hypothetical protein
VPFAGCGDDEDFQVCSLRSRFNASTTYPMGGSPITVNLVWRTSPFRRSR